MIDRQETILEVVYVVRDTLFALFTHPLVDVTQSLCSLRLLLLTITYILQTIVNGSSFHINYRFLGYRYCVQSSDKLTPVELLIILFLIHINDY